MRISATFMLLGAWLVGVPASTLAQKVVDQQTRFWFAQMHLGLDGQYIPPVRSGYLSATGEQRPFITPGTYHPRFTIGATHFWGLMDLYVSFPLGSVRPEAAEVEKYSVSTNVTTGARVHPLQLRYHRLNPYIGVAWSTLSYNQRVTERLSGTTFTKDVITLEGGLNWLTGPHWFELGVHHLPNRELTYATSRQTTTPVRFPAFTVQVAYKFLLDATLHLEKDNKETYGQYLRERRQLSGFHLDIGPSAAFTLVRSDYNTRNRPYLNNPSGNKTFLDLSAGYYFFKPEFDIRLAHRHIVADHTAYGLSQRLARRSISLDVYKYLLDYHGFVPFLGLSFAREQLGVRESDDGILVTNHTERQYAPGLVFGWDIRPVRYESILLRTNLPTRPFSKRGSTARPSRFSNSNSILSRRSFIPSGCWLIGDFSIGSSPVFQFNA